MKETAPDFVSLSSFSFFGGEKAIFLALTSRGGKESMEDTTMHSTPITFIEKFELIAPLADFQEAVTAFSRRIEQDGVQSVLTYQFYANQKASEAFLIVRGLEVNNQANR